MSDISDIAIFIAGRYSLTGSNTIIVSPMSLTVTTSYNIYFILRWLKHKQIVYDFSLVDDVFENTVIVTLNLTMLESQDNPLMFHKFGWINNKNLR